jgi:NAD-dependent dihydropyrimidine dehydrogenase PreA subunit
VVWREGELTVSTRELHDPLGVSMPPESAAPGPGWHVTVSEAGCENRRDCVRVCPERVFEMRRPRIRNPLLWLKMKAHGGLQAVPVRPDACTGCMACVSACPEHAIIVVPRPDP